MRHQETGTETNAPHAPANGKAKNVRAKPVRGAMEAGAARPIASRERRVLVRFGALVLRLPRYARLAGRLAREQRIPAKQRALALAGVAYAVSPICIIPGALDDLAVLLLCIRHLVRNCPAEVMAEHLQQTDITAAAIDADLATVKETAILAVRKTGQVAGRAAFGLGRLAIRGAVRLLTNPAGRAVRT